MQTDGASNGIDQDRIGGGQWDDIRQVDLEEVGLSENGLIGDIANADQDQEDPSDEIAEGTEDTMPEHLRSAPADLRTSRSFPEQGQLCHGPLSSTWWWRG